ncbi:MAG: hypothetical protein SFV15_00480 [Polyangiaceae bacterium]|nr:hypothetical protein [Polyangiaceae bacterium]
MTDHAKKAELPALRANLLLPGLYAWVSTVGYPAFAGSGWLARSLSFVSVLSLLGGAWFLRSQPLLGRVLGVYCFLGGAVATWVAIGPGLALLTGAPVRAAVGGLGWLLFALGWGYLRQRGNVPERDPRAIAGEPLLPRAQLSPVTSVVFAVSLAGSLGILALAWRVERPAQALLAHAVAAAGVVWLMSASARVSTSLGESRSFPSARRRMNLAARPLSALILAFAFGTVWVFLK